MNIEIKLKTEKKVTVDFLEKESRLTKNTPMEESTS